MTQMGEYSTICINYYILCFSRNKHPTLYCCLGRRSSLHTCFTIQDFTVTPVHYIVTHIMKANVGKTYVDTWHSLINLMMYQNIV